MKRLVKRASMLTFVLVLFMSITGCAEDLGEQYIKNDFVESLWGIAIEEFNCPIDFPTDTEIVAIADQILDGKMIVLYSMDNMLEYNPDVMDTFDWNVQYSNTPNTFQLYLQCLNKSFPIFRTIDFCKKAPLLSHLQIPAYTLTELFCKNYTTLQIKSGIAPSVACQIVLKSIVYIVLFCYNWTIYFTQFS